MLVIVQIPIFDIRRFQEKSIEPINKINWKLLQDSDVQSKFIRSIGPIDIRKTGPTSENYYSKAKRGIRFINLPIIKVSVDGNEIQVQIRPRFRRFFFDGTVCGKYEIGFSIELKKNQHITNQSFKDFLTSLFKCKVIIPIPFKTKVESTVIDCGKYLAEQYLYATTNKKNINHNQLYGVYPGFPCIYFEKQENETILGDIIQKSVIVKQPEGVSIGLTKLEISKKLIKVWYCVADTNLKVTTAREIRIAILRLNVFREALHFVFKKIEENKILPNPRSNESEELQSFFKDCFGKYLRKLPEKLSDSDYETMAIQIEDKFAIVNRKQLEYNLRKVIDIRGNYFNSIKEYLEKLENSTNENMKIQEITITRTTILFLSSNPSNTARLRIDKEAREVEEALRRAKKGDSFDFAIKLATRPRDLSRAILDENPQILHFSGHGKTEGIVLENDSGKAKTVTTEAISGLFSLFSDKVKCVLLNSCYSESQAQEISKYIPYVIGMSKTIPDATAIAFAISFYDAIGSGRDIEFAFNFGVSNIRLEGLAGVKIPVLLKKAK